MEKHFLWLYWMSAAMSPSDSALAVSRIDMWISLVCECTYNMLYAFYECLQLTWLNDFFLHFLVSFSSEKVNNAGIGIVGPVESITLEEMKTVFETNLFGVIRVIKEVMPDMKKRRAGHIIVISSVLGVQSEQRQCCEGRSEKRGGGWGVKWYRVKWQVGLLQCDGWLSGWWTNGGPDWEEGRLIH